MSTSPSDTVLDLTRSFGQPLLGTLIATAFWGMQLTQTLMYFLTYPTDGLYLKILVILLLILDTAHELLIIKVVWFALIPEFGSAGHITHLQRESFAQLAVTGVVTLLAQFFFTWRIFRFTNNSWIFPIILVPPTIGQLIACSVYVFEATHVEKPALFLTTPPVRKAALAITISDGITDILIAVCMCVILWRSRTGLLSSHRMIVRLMNASVSTGVCTAVWALFAFIAICAWPRDLIFALGEIPMATLYCNAVLANLNSRRYIRGTNMMVDVFSSDWSSGSSARSSQPSQSLRLQP